MAHGVPVCAETYARDGLKDEEFCLRLLDEHDVACVPGSAFGACGEGFVRMSYATSLEKIRVATERLTAFLRSLQAR